MAYRAIAYTVMAYIVIAQDVELFAEDVDPSTAATAVAAISPLFLSTAADASATAEEELCSLVSAVIAANRIADPDVDGVRRCMHEHAVLLARASGELFLFCFQQRD